MMTWGSFVIFIEFSRMDRNLMLCLFKAFDFWLLSLSLITSVALNMYGMIWCTDFCVRGRDPDTFSYVNNALDNIAANYFYFWMNLITFCADATPSTSRGSRIFILVLNLLNALRLFIIDRFLLSSSFQGLCGVPVYYNDHVVTNTHDLGFGCFLTITMFQMRYLYRHIVMPGTFALLDVPIKIQSFQQ